MTLTEYHLGLALEMCVDSHRGQTRRDGKTPYSVHPFRVAQGLSTIPEKIVALLHDVPEDTDVEIEEIYQLFGDDVGDAVHILTKKDNQVYDEYIIGVKKNELARVVKLQDMRDNINSKPSQKQVQKYTKAAQYLKEQS